MVSMLDLRKKQRYSQVAADGITFKVTTNTVSFLDVFLTRYNRDSGKKPIGRSKYLWKLLKEWRNDQRALIRYAGVDHTLFDKSLMIALKAFRQICFDQVSKSIRTQSDAVVALLMYHHVRLWEKKQDEYKEKLTNYLDAEFEDDMELLKEKQKTNKDLRLEDLYEET